MLTAVLSALCFGWVSRSLATYYNYLHSADKKLSKALRNIKCLDQGQTANEVATGRKIPVGAGD